MKKKLSDLTLEELLKRKSTLKGILLAFMVIFTLAIVVLIYLKPKPVLYTPLFTFPVTLLPLSIAFKLINDEIKLRNANTSAKA